MIQSEWFSLLKNKFLLVVVGAIICIPALYNLIFLGALWDPYGKLDKLPVAIVNQDKQVYYQGKELALGKDVTEHLLKKKPLDFHLVSNKEAEKEITRGKYYMIVMIPENFSKDATSLLSKNPKQMTIDYQTSQGLNLTASKMSASAITELKDRVSTEVTGMYTEAVLRNLGNAGQGMAKATAGVENLSDGTKQLMGATQTISKNLTTLSNSSLNFSDGSQILTNGLQQYVAGVVHVGNGADKLVQGINTLAEKGPELVNGFSYLSEGSISLTNGINQYTSGVGSVAAGPQALDSGIGQLASKLPVLSNNTEQLTKGSSSLNEGINQYVSSITSANTGVKKISDGVQQLAVQIEQLPQQVKNLHKGTEKIVTGLQNVQLSEEDKRQLIAYTDCVNSYIYQVSQAFGVMDLSGLSNLGQLTDMVRELSDQLTAMSVSASNITQKMEETKQALTRSYQADLATNANAVVSHLTSTGVTLTEEQKASVLSTMQAQNSQTMTAVNQLNIDTGQLTEQIAAQQQSLTKLSTALSALQGIPVDQISQLKQGADQLAQASGKAAPKLKTIVNGMFTIGNQLMPSAQAVNNGVGQLDTNIPALTNGIQKLAEESNSVSQGTQQLVQNGQRLSKNSDQLAQGTATINKNIPELTGSAQKLVQGSKKVTSGTEQLTEKSLSLVKGAQQVTTGLNLFNQNILALNTGISALHGGSQQLSQGIGQLTANGGQLLASAQQLQNGSQKIAEGSGKLVVGGNQVTHSLGTMGTGLGTLINQLASGSKEIGQINTGKTGAKTIAQPLRTTHNDSDKLANNGTGMAPYMMSVALFIGTISFNLLFDAFKPTKKPTTGLAWWASKASILAVVSIMQSLLVDAALMGLLGMDVLHPLKVVAFSILVSTTFMSIVTLFNLLLGKIGSFIMLLFMILQLAASGGTYPIELSGHFYQAVNPFLPMTYSIRALREGISIGGSMLTETLLFLILLFISNVLIIVFFTKKRKNPVAFEEEWS